LTTLTYALCGALVGYLLWRLAMYWLAHRK
jgi:hypothetical protein